MPFVPHTKAETQSMLDTIGVNSIEDLFDEIPSNLRAPELSKIPKGLGEAELAKLMYQKANMDGLNQCFIGAGSYAHHIPAAVWDLVGRGEFMTAYTPYQAEASQGGLQLIYEYQTMMASLMGMDISNASMYDGASSLAEACLTAVRANKKCKSTKIGVIGTLSREVEITVKTIIGQQNLELVTDANIETDDLIAVVIPQPTFFGTIQETDQITDLAHSKNMLVIAMVNPMAMSLLKPPGQWGETGADVCCGEGQPLGVPMASGGPYFGFMCCKKAIVRQMPGRIVGRTTDTKGREGFCLTLQAREQHIRRAKATSNICTNQGLLVTAATIYMSLIGFKGLQKIAKQSHANTTYLRSKIAEFADVNISENIFHEFVVTFKKPVAEIIDKMADAQIHAGYDLSEDFPELGNAMLVCATEVHSQSDLDNYITQLKKCI